MKLCGGIQSPVNPSLSLRLCRECARFQFAEETLKPAPRRAGGTSWLCENHVSSLPAEMPASGRAGTETGAAVFLSGGEVAGEHRAAVVCEAIAPPVCAVSHKGEMA